MRVWSRLSVLTGGALGLAAFASSLGLALVHPTSTEWLMFGDTRQHFLGWHTFRGAPWQWPLGANAHYGWPIGTSVALTDSIPLLAIPFKLLHPLLPPRFQFIGGWLLTCFVLQGVFGVLLMRRVTTRALWHVCGAAMFVLAPVLVHRTGHPALTAHWLILAAMWLHLRADNDEQATARWSLVCWAIVVAAAAATHAYLALMVLALMIAHFAGAALTATERRRRALLAPVGLLALFGVVFWQSGYLVVSGGDLAPGDFGAYSVDLLFAPLLPIHAASFTDLWLRVPSTDAVESHAYLGAGVLLLAVPALVGGVRHGRITARGLLRSRHLPMACAFLVLLAMAAGPLVRVGGVEVLRYDGSWWGPLTVFRANGRMAWPLLYLLTFSTLAGVCRLPVRVASGLLIVGVLAQALDISPLYAATRSVQRARWTTPLADPLWNEVTPQYRQLVALPPNLCAEERAAVAVEPFALLAGDHDVALNLGTAARFDAAALRSYCEQLAAQVGAGQFSPDAVYVLTPELAPAVMLRAQVPIVCLPVNKHIVCARRETYGRWQDVREVTAEVLPAAADFVSARRDLSDEYARMQRPLVTLRGSVDERMAALRMYLVYRVTGCADDEASSKVLRTTRGESEIRACGNPLTVRRPFPSRDEVLLFIRTLDDTLTALGRPPLQSTLDREGEAVWLLEYAKARAAGGSDDAAQDQVRESIRALVRGL